jgi:O-antigen ligase
MLLGVFPFLLTVSHSVMAIISWVDWPGYVKGAEFTVLDGFALALYFSLPGDKRPLPFRFAMGSYFLAVMLSALQAKVPLPAYFYCWQLARMFIVYVVVARGCSNPRLAPALLTGLATGLILEAFDTVLQRGSGVLQAAGTFGHQNLLGLLSHFIVFPFFALLLAAQPGRLPIAVGLAGIVVEVLTTSRATVGLAVLGYALLFVFSASRGWTSRKKHVLLVGVVAISVIVPLALSSFEQRLAGEAGMASDYDERAAFERAAAGMLSDHPMGVGSNNYVIAANTEGYNNVAGVAAMENSDGAHVHNVYRLVAAETGYLGLLTFVFLLCRPLMVAFACGLRYKGDRRGDLLLGLAVALLIVYLHSLYEWSLAISEAQYMLAIAIGLVAGTAQQLGYWQAAQTVPARETYADRSSVGQLAPGTRSGSK